MKVWGACSQALFWACAVGPPTLPGAGSLWGAGDLIAHPTYQDWELCSNPASLWGWSYLAYQVNAVETGMH